MDSFEQRNQENVKRMSRDSEFKDLTRQWLDTCLQYEYMYHFSWLGVPIIQSPQDIVAMQELVWKVKPDLIIETGIARGGSMIFYASLLEMIGGHGRVVGIDIDIRAPNRKALENHAMFKRITLLEGSSVDEALIRQVKAIAAESKTVMVALDSNHVHDHVYAEMCAYAPLVTPGSYLVVFDTVIEDIAPKYNADRPWSKGNNPKTAVREFLKDHPEFEVDQQTEDKLCITVCPNGFLRRVS